MTNEILMDEILNDEELDAVNGGDMGSVIRGVGGTWLGAVAIVFSVATCNPALAVAGGAALITGASGIADTVEGK